MLETRRMWTSPTAALGASFAQGAARTRNEGSDDKHTGEHSGRAPIAQPAPHSMVSFRDAGPVKPRVAGGGASVGRIRSAEDARWPETTDCGKSRGPLTTSRSHAVTEMQRAAA